MCESRWFFFLERPDNNVKTVYYNRMNMAHSSTVDWTREPMSSMKTIMNTLAEDMKWFETRRKNKPSSRTFI